MAHGVSPTQKERADQRPYKQEAQQRDWAQCQIRLEMRLIPVMVFVFKHFPHTPGLGLTDSPEGPSLRFHRTKPTLSGWQARQLVIPPIKTYPGGADRRLLAPVYGFSAAAGFAAAEIAILFSSVSNSMGSGKTMVVFFSTPISVSVCR